MSFRAMGFFASSLSAAKPGMVLLTPTSIAHSGTSASIGANGQVTFTAVTSLSLNGVFTADFDNYVVSMRGVVSTSVQNIHVRFRVGGSDASGANYTNQYNSADNTSVGAARTSSETVLVAGGIASSQPNGLYFSIYGPYLAQPTALRGLGVAGYLGGYLQDQAGTHSLATSYDGMTLFPSSGNLTGALQVYGIRS